MRQWLIIIVILCGLSVSHAAKMKNNLPDDLSWLNVIGDSRSTDTDDDNDNEIRSANVCNTKECLQIANSFSESINKSADPCFDFYDFACGAWKSKNPKPKYEPVWSKAMIWMSLVNQRIRDILQAEPTRQDILPLRQAKKWYRSCMDVENREARGLRPVESILMQTGGWPMAMDSQEWNEAEHSWQEIDAYYARLLGQYSLYRIDIDDKEISISTPSLPFEMDLPSESRNYTGETYDAYKSLLKKIAKLFIDHSQADVSEEQLDRDCRDVIKFEGELYKAMLDRAIVESDDVEFSKEADFTLNSFEEAWENRTHSITNRNAKINWRSAIQRLFNMVDAQVDGNSKISVARKHYLNKLLHILKSADKRTIVNYIHWKFLSEVLKYTNDEVRDVLFELTKEELQLEARRPRWLECVREMRMDDAAAYVFVKEYFSKETARKAKKIMDNIKIELENKIINSNWMSAEAKEAAREKFRAMGTLIGFPDWYNNRTAVLNHYKGLAIGTEYLDNILNYKRYEMRLKLRIFLGYESSPGWTMDPITVNALYRRESNVMNVPAAIFQSPLLGHKVPDYVNYAVTGVVIGHEMGHAYDNKGIKVSATGDALLAETMLKIYYQQTKCFVDHYDVYFKGETLPPMFVDWFKDYQDMDLSDSDELSRGWLTATENIADITGLQAVLSAYKEMIKKEEPNGELKLPGFEEFSDEQMFFISFAEIWCEVLSPELEEMKNKNYDVHSPTQFRVLGSVSNTLDFARAFNCPKGSPMNPEDKCDIWTKSGAAPQLEKTKRTRRHHWYDMRNW